MAFATIGAPMTFTVRAARHAKKKATKGHRDTRPKKTSPSQRRRTPTEYPTVDPASVPAVMTVVSRRERENDGGDDGGEGGDIWWAWKNEDEIHSQV